MVLESKRFVIASFATSVQLLLYGCNIVLFTIGIRLLWRRNSCHAFIFHIVSTIILFLLATMSAVTLAIQTGATMGEWTKVNVPACSFVIYVVIQFLSLTALIILVYRCYHICGRSLKVIVLPVLLILVETGSYYADFKSMIEINFADGGASGNRTMPKALVITSTMCETL
ncbi:hypothetical protein PM082_022901 [Marasmius tenuissimus]|nr:hypothetical protein PM082_022901 [Marasmius tenuissimus]